MGPSLKAANRDGFKGRYVLNSAVVGQVGLAELDDGSIYVVFVGNWSKLQPYEIRPPRRGS